MKTLSIFLLILISSYCFAQDPLDKPASDERTITTAGHTYTIGSFSANAVLFTVTNESATDTLQFRTDFETTWHTLYPGSKFGTTYGESYTTPGRVYASKIYRRIVNGTGILSRLWIY
jgi:hypothetical protein